MFIVNIPPPYFSIILVFKIPKCKVCFSISFISYIQIFLIFQKIQ
jgi:hypothetical protein